MFRCHRIHVAAITAACLLLPLISAAQSKEKPDFSGRWRMDKEKSDFGSFPPPNAIVRVVDERPPTMNVHTIQTNGSKTTTADVSYFINGDPSANVISGRDATSKSYWDGPVLVIRTEMKDSNGNDSVTEDRWELSEDHRSLTTTSHINTTKGAADFKLVCNREVQ